jgi:RNA polymerase sigma-70 factor (ECF subfamily)
VSLAATRHVAPEEVTTRPSFRHVYQSNAALVWRVLRRLGMPPSDLEDLCQEVFVAVHRKLAHFEGKSTLRTWIYGIAVRCASDHRRRGHIKHEIATEKPVEQVADPPQLVVIQQREARARLDAIIAGLDEDKRAVFVLYELEQLAMKDVAEALDCPVQTAYSRLHAARHQVEAAVARLAKREEAP